MGRSRICSRLALALLALPAFVQAQSQSQGPAGVAASKAAPRFFEPRAYDLSPPLRSRPRQGALARRLPQEEIVEPRPDRGPAVADQGHAADAALQSRPGPGARGPSALLQVEAPQVNFEGLSNQDNFDVLGFRVAPPDPIGDIGPNHYVQMINLVFAVYDRQGHRLLGPTALGELWAGFSVDDCTDPSGDPVVLHDQLEDRWILSQFTTRGPLFYNCIAVSQTADPTGAWHRYAFPAGAFFPDYPKHGVWTDSYLMTTRDFGPNGEYGISVWALEKHRMLAGDPRARGVQFFLDAATVPIHLIGDGLLPPDLDGHRRPPPHQPIPVVGTQDDGHPYGGAFDALNLWELDIKWRSTPRASLALATQLPVAAFDSLFPCVPGSRDCLPQPGVVDPNRFLDILSYRQRPTWRLAYRNMGSHEAMVTSQSVEARPGVAGMRWYEIRRTGSGYVVHQQGSFAPEDGVHRWMGSVAMDRLGNIALGYSVVNGVDVYPGIRYTGRLAGDPLGQMTLGEGVVVHGSGAQLTTNSRWGDYTSMNVDPLDDCTFWYVNQYYATTSTAGWQTRIASFRLPGCD